MQIDSDPFPFHSFTAPLFLVDHLYYIFERHIHTKPGPLPLFHVS